MKERDTMYESFFGLKKNPFTLHPDPEYFYMSKGHKSACLHLEHAIMERKSFVVITGEIGSGKTTLLNYLLRNTENDIRIGLINNTAGISPREFIKFICQKFNIAVEEFDKPAMLASLAQFFHKSHASNKRVALIVDEAQILLPETIEEIRLLSNLETEKDHLIQIILVGQPELRTMLRQNKLKQFAQRVSVYYHLAGLNRSEVGAYIRHRLKVAGSSQTNLFEEEAIEAVYECSNGLPRIINVLCDTALINGYADGIKKITRDIIVNIQKSRTEELFGSEEHPDEPSRRNKKKPLLKASYKTKELTESLEKLPLLEQAIVNLDRRIKVWEEQKRDRDEVVVKLVGMLKSSMDDRLKLAKEVIKLREKQTPD
jgi:general secretion pathway protein A